MSLVSCIMAKMQGDMGTSDCEDKAANLTTRKRSATEQASELGKMLSNTEGQIGEVRSQLRNCDNARYNQAYQQDLPQIESDMANLQDVLSQLAQQQINYEAEKKSFMAEEKELDAEIAKNDVMMKLNQGASQKFGGMVDGAIKRFFGGGGQG